MKKLFNKNFFKFMAGFIGIIALAMLSVLAISAYEVNNSGNINTVGNQTTAK